MKKSALFLAIMLMAVGIHAQKSADAADAAKNYTPLHWAASQGYTEMMKVLSAKGYDINVKDESGFSPLHYAAVSGHMETVQYLVEAGADIYAVNLQNYTPLSLAAKSGQQGIVDFLFVKMRSARIDQLKAQVEKERVETDLAQAAKARYEAERLRTKAEEWTSEAKRWRDEAERWNKEAQDWKTKQSLLDKVAQERLEEAMKAQQASEEKYLNERAAKLEALRYAEEVAAAQRAQAQAREAAEAALRAQQAGSQVIDNLIREIEKQSGPSAQPARGGFTNQSGTSAASSAVSSYGAELPPTNEMIIPESVFQDPDKMLDPQVPTFSGDSSMIIDEL